MGSFTKYFIFLAVAFLALNNQQLIAMTRSKNVDFKKYNQQENNTHAINLFDTCIVIAIEMIDRELSSWIAEQMDNHSKRSVSEMDDGNSIPHWDYLALKQLLECCWDAGLNNKYQIFTSEFIEIVKIRYQINEEYLEIIKYNDSYTLEQLLQLVISMLLQDLHLEISDVEFLNITKKIVVTYALQKFLEPNEQLTWCNCSQVSIGERVVMLIMSLEKICNNFSPKKCTSDNPLVYTSFGSGALLYDFIAISLLSNCYKYFKLNFIDTFYDQNMLKDYKKWSEEPFTFQLGFYEGNFSFNFFGNVDTYLHSSPDMNHILSTIDTIQHDNCSSQFNQLIKKTSDRNSVVGSLSEHKICYAFNAQLKHSLTS